MDKPFRLEEIPCYRLKVDHSYQRPAEKKRIEQFVGSFSEMSLGTLLVGAREDTGEYYIIDGQHRWAAAKEVLGGTYEISCKVWLGTTSRQEAEVFALVNNGHKKVRPGLTIKAGAIAGDKSSIEILEAIKESGGLEPDYSSTKSKEFQVASWGTLADIYRDGGKQALKDALATAGGMWGWTADSLSAFSLLGTHRFLKENSGKSAWRLPTSHFRINEVGFGMVKMKASKTIGSSYADRWAKALVWAHDLNQDKRDRLGR